MSLSGDLYEKMKKQAVHKFEEAWRLYYVALNEMVEGEEDTLINPDDWLQDRSTHATAWLHLAQIPGAVLKNSIKEYVGFMTDNF